MIWMMANGNHDNHMSLDDFDVSSWDSDNDLQMIVDWFNYYVTHDQMSLDEFLSMCEGNF